MARQYIAIMREVYRATRAGVSAPVALLAAVEDDEWEVVLQELFARARLHSALNKRKPKGK